MPVIPGLLRCHFVRGSNNVAPTPKLTKAKVEDDGSFDFQWRAKGSKKGDTYSLSARGPSADRLVVDCKCISFVKDQAPRIQQSKSKKLFVCKHLAKALESVLDPEAVQESEDSDDDDKLFIPGLTPHHYVRGSNHETPHIPKVLKASVNKSSGEFDLEWDIEASGDSGERYKLSAKGNILERQRKVRYGRRGWWGFQAYCECASFSDQEWETQRSGWTRNLVCKHLAAALDSVVDPDTSLSDYYRK